MSLKKVVGRGITYGFAPLYFIIDLLIKNLTQNRWEGQWWWLIVERALPTPEI